MAIQISQIELISAICLHIEKKHKGTELTVRQMNAIIQAATDITTAMGLDDKGFADGCGVSAWLASDKTGLSSRFMCRVLTGFGGGTENNYPRDPGDFNRCVGLLKAAPELREKLPMMRQYGDQWKGLVDHWEELEALLEKELPTGSAPKLYKRMQEVMKQ